MFRSGGIIFLNHHFTIKTDRKSLKYILEQRFTTYFQQKWLVKLMEFDFAIEYKQGQNNIAVNALSRVQLSECCQLLVHQVQSDMLAKIKQNWSMDDILKRLLRRFKQILVLIIISHGRMVN